jgi:Tfp pilus assembly protein FimT
MQKKPLITTQSSIKEFNLQNTFNNIQFVPTGRERSSPHNVFASKSRLSPIEYQNLNISIYYKTYTTF